MNFNVQGMKENAINMFKSSNKLNILWIAVILGLFILLSYYVYVTYIKPVINKNYSENDEFNKVDPHIDLTADLF